MRTGLADHVVVDVVPGRGGRAKDGGAGPARAPGAALEGLGRGDVRADGVENVLPAGAAARVAGARRQHAGQHRGDVVQVDEAALGRVVRRGKRRRGGAAAPVLLAGLVGRVRDAGAPAPFALEPRGAFHLCAAAAREAWERLFFPGVSYILALHDPRNRANWPLLLFHGPLDIISLEIIGNASA